MRSPAFWAPQLPSSVSSAERATPRCGRGCRCGGSFPRRGVNPIDENLQNLVQVRPSTRAFEKIVLYLAGDPAAHVGLGISLFRGAAFAGFERNVLHPCIREG